MDEKPKKIGDPKNMHAKIGKLKDVSQHCGPNHIFNFYLTLTSRLSGFLINCNNCQK